MFNVQCSMGKFVLNILAGGIALSLFLLSAEAAPRGTVVDPSLVEHRSSSSPDPLGIARGALLVSLPGEWSMTALLTTRVSPSKFLQPQSRDFPKSGLAQQESHLTIQLKHESDGSHWMIYRLANDHGPEEGLRVHILKDGGLQLFGLSSERPIQDPSAALFGSAFSYEDVSLKFLSWPTQTFLGEETVRDRRCWRIASHPPPSDHNPHRHVESWIDQQYHAPLKAVAYDENVREVKEFHIHSFQQIENVWMVRTLEIAVPTTGARSRLEILDARKGSGK